MSLQNNENSFLNNKRTKNSHLYNQLSGFKKKDEEKIMKYVLKISKEEYNNSLINNVKEKVKTILDLEPSPEFKATEIDFLEFSKYIDALWNETSDFGAFKIIPPQKFCENIKLCYISKIDHHLENNSEKKIQFKVQNLKDIYKSEKFEIAKDVDYIKYKQLGSEVVEKIFNNNSCNEDKILRSNTKSNNNRNNKSNEKSKSNNNNTKSVTSKKSSFDNSESGIKEGDKKSILSPIENKQTKKEKKSIDGLNENNVENNVENNDEEANSEDNNVLDYYPCDEEIELKYWELTKPDSNVNCEILYASDIELIKFFPKTDIKRFMFPFFLPNYFSLLNACFLPDSLFQFSQKDGEEVIISGVNVPFLCVGMIFSTFCWHVEDLYMYSVSYLHEGSPKIWYSVSLKDKDRFDDFVRKKFLVNAMKDSKFLYNLSIFIDPIELIQSGIDVKRTVQYPGEMIVTLPKTYHMGINLGYNKSETVNYTTSKWLQYGKEALIEYKRSNAKSPVFSFDWLLFKNNFYKNDIILSERSIKTLNSFIQECIDTEFSARENIEQYCNNNEITKTILSLESKYATSCSVCIEINYLSYMECINCKKKMCISHLIQCKCNTKAVNLYYRHKNDLYYYSKSKKPHQANSNSQVAQYKNDNNGSVNQNDYSVSKQKGTGTSEQVKSEN